jgi:hypothetical protein
MQADVALVEQRAAELNGQVIFMLLPGTEYEAAEGMVVFTHVIDFADKTANTHYFSSTAGGVVERPSHSVVNFSVPVNTVQTVVLPTGTKTVQINSQIETFTDTELELVSPDPGTFVVSVECWPYKPIHFVGEFV